MGANHIDFVTQLVYGDLGVAELAPQPRPALAITSTGHSIDSPALRRRR
jgi:hypothetical protein